MFTRLKATTKISTPANVPSNAAAPALESCAAKQDGGQCIERVGLTRKSTAHAHTREQDDAGDAGACATKRIGQDEHPIDGDSAQIGGSNVAADKVKTASERGRLLDQQPDGGNRKEDRHHSRNMPPRSAADRALEPGSEAPLAVPPV